MPSSNPAAVIVGKTGNSVDFKLQKYVTLTCNLEPERDAVIENPDGVRFKMKYTPGGNVVLEGEQNLAGTPLVGQINSGGDWVFARKDGVIFIDSRVTIAFDFKDPNLANTAPVALVDATLKGTIDLVRTFTSQARTPTGEEAYADFLAGTAPIQTLPNSQDFCHHITGALRFEVGDGNGGSGAKDWGHVNIRETAKRFDRLKVLVRQQFLTIGTITINKTRRLDAKQIVVEAWGL